jgi:hypothetical protein
MAEMVCKCGQVLALLKGPRRSWKDQVGVPTNRKTAVYLCNRKLAAVSSGKQLRIVYLNFEPTVKGRD